MGLIAEIGEFLEADKQWKQWGNSNKESHEDAARQELIDCLLFLINLMLSYNMGYPEIIDTYNKKVSELEKRHGIQFSHLEKEG